MTLCVNGLNPVLSRNILGTTQNSKPNYLLTQENYNHNLDNKKLKTEELLNHYTSQHLITPKKLSFQSMSVISIIGKVGEKKFPEEKHLPINPNVDFQKLNMQEGDLLIFSGIDPFSQTLKWATSNPISHVAIVKKDKTGKSVITQFHANGNETYPIEKILEKHPDEISLIRIKPRIRTKFRSKRFEKFVNKTSEQQRAYHYKGLASGPIWYRSLKAIIKETLHRHTSDKYHKHRDFEFNNVAHDKMICSEFAIVALQEAGVLPKCINARYIAPHQVVQLGFINNLWGEIVDIRGNLSSKIDSLKSQNLSLPAY